MTVPSFWPGSVVYSNPSSLMSRSIGKRWPAAHLRDNYHSCPPLNESHPALRIGIDFGTTNSSIARVTPGGVELVRFANGAGLDSVSSRSILYLEKAKHGILASSGPLAIERYLEAHLEGDRPGRLIQSLKSYLPVRSLTGTEVFGRHYTLEDLISRILGDLRARAEEQFGEPVRHAVAGRPVRFVGAETAEDEELALTRLRAAYERAGFESVAFELEPLAAAFAYQATLDHEETILIGDFGGGTSDFSLVTVGPKSKRVVLGNAGLPFAGDAFDARLVRKLIAPALGSESLARGLNKTLPAVPAWIYANLEGGTTCRSSGRAMYWRFSPRGEAGAGTGEDRGVAGADRSGSWLSTPSSGVQRTKNALSAQEVAPFVFAGPEAGTLELRTSVTRAQFEEWIAPELAQIAETVDGLVGDAAADIDRVFLTGGTSFVPAVRAIFEARFAGRVVTGGEFTSVAQGLALANEG